MKHILENISGHVVAGLILAGILGTVTIASMASENSSDITDLKAANISTRHVLHEQNLEQREQGKMLAEIANDVKWLVSRQK